MGTLHRLPGSAGRIRTVEEPEFYQVLEATPGPVLVFFTSAGCSSCRAWRRLLEAYLEGRDGRYRDISVFVVDAESNMGLVREYDVFHLPALFLFQDGEFHCALQCEARLASLDTAIGTALAAPAQEAP